MLDQLAEVGGAGAPRHCSLALLGLAVMEPAGGGEKLSSSVLVVILKHSAVVQPREVGFNRRPVRERNVVAHVSSLS